MICDVFFVSNVAAVVNMLKYFKTGLPGHGRLS